MSKLLYFFLNGPTLKKDEQLAIAKLSEDKTPEAKQLVCAGMLYGLTSGVLIPALALGWMLPIMLVGGILRVFVCILWTCVWLYFARLHKAKGNRWVKEVIEHTKSASNRIDELRPTARNESKKMKYKIATVSMMALIVFLIIRANNILENASYLTFLVACGLCFLAFTITCAFYSAWKPEAPRAGEHEPQDQEN